MLKSYALHQSKPHISLFFSSWIISEFSRQFKQISYHICIKQQNTGSVPLLAQDSSFWQVSGSSILFWMNFKRNLNRPKTYFHYLVCVTVSAWQKHLLVMSKNTPTYTEGPDKRHNLNLFLCQEMKQSHSSPYDDIISCVYLVNSSFFSANAKICLQFL